MRQSVAANSDDIDLLTLGGSLKRALPRLILYALMAGAVTYLALSTIAPRHTANAEIAITAKGSNNPFTSPSANGNLETLTSRMDERAVNTHVRAIQAPDLLERVAADLDLAAKPEFNPALGPVDTFDRTLRMLGLADSGSDLSVADRVLNEIQDRLVVYGPKESRAITIAFTSIDPELAAGFANRLAETYRETLAKATVAETSAVQEKLAPRIAKLQAEVAEAAANVAKFRNSADLLRAGSQKTPVNEQQLAEVSSELTRVRTARTAAETRARNARDLMRRGTPEVIPEVQRSPLIQNLISQRVSVEREILRRSASLKPAHPVMKQLSADLRAVNRQIAGEIANVVASLDKEAFVAAEQEKAVDKRLVNAKSKVAVNTTDEVELRRLESMATAKRAELSRLQAQFEANRAGSENGAVPVEAQILTFARTPSIPVFPKKLPYTVLAALATFLIGTAFVITAGLTRQARAETMEEPSLTEAPQADLKSSLVREMTATAAKAPPPPAGPKPVEPEIAAPPLTAVPGLTSVENTEELAGLIAEASNATTTGFRTLLASRLQPEEAAAEALDLATALNATGKRAIIIEWSMDGGRIARHFRLPTSPGFMELLKGRASFGEIVRWIPGTEVHFIASGWAFAEGPEGLDTDQLNLILDALDEAYDHIILTSEYKAARVLFETIQGRFDAGILAVGNDAESPVEPGSFLGFHVTDIELYQLKCKPVAHGTAA